MNRSASTLLCASVLALGTIGCSAAQPSVAATPAPVFPPSTNAARPLSPFVKANGFIFLAGQLGTDSTGRLVPGGIKEETRQTMMNIKTILERNGSSMDKIVRCLVLLADVNDRAAMSEVYVTFFSPATRPARTAAGANGLALNGKVEIECTATE
jgi:reactive intermediate/imine deaminase